MTDKILIPTQKVQAAADMIAAPVQDVAGAKLAGLAGAAHDLSMWSLFLHADIIVKFVMLLLIVASVVSWAIIFQKFSLLSLTRRKLASFLNLFWDGRSGKTMEEFYNEVKKAANDPLSRVFVAGMYECYDQKNKRNQRKRAERALNNAATRELNHLERHISFLATVGSSAPFIGLFGTVWGIMNSFQSIAATNNTSLAVVAPGIAEALFATAIGLFAAIPASIFYNKFNTEIAKVSNELDDFVDELVIYVEREFE
jgi:biopolymer transport protein TolQ